ncbi:hypothetical protein ABH912_006133 [Pseudomonas sp. BT76 TE3572]|uniref:hypothetical protein n=1 Tax=Pseudomonas sp. BT76 TE3572 TaxID=3349325 RepID=UPI003D25EDAB
MKKPLGSRLTGRTGQQRERPQTTDVARGKNWIVLNVEPIALAFKANVLHRVKPLTMPID